MVDYIKIQIDVDKDKRKQIVEFLKDFYDNHKEESTQPLNLEEQPDLDKEDGNITTIQPLHLSPESARQLKKAMKEKFPKIAFNIIDSDGLEV